MTTTIVTLLSTYLLYLLPANFFRLSKKNVFLVSQQGNTANEYSCNCDSLCEDGTFKKLSDTIKQRLPKSFYQNRLLSSFSFLQSTNHSIFDDFSIGQHFPNNQLCAFKTTMMNFLCLSLVAFYPLSYFE